jgi:hypothetical protein
MTSSLKYLFEKAKINHTKEKLNTHQEIKRMIFILQESLLEVIKALETREK